MAHSRAVVSMLSAVALLAAVSARAATTTNSMENPSVSFATPGQKQVMLQACNAKGCSTVMQTITVLDPRPVILTSLVGATTVEAGQLVNLVATAKGQPPLTYTWQVTSATVPEVDVTGAGAWWDTTGVAPGTYNVALHLANGAGTADSLATQVVVTAPTPKQFYTITPCRLLDTRQTNALASGSKLTFAAAGISAFACGIPATAKALSVNVTVVGPTGDGFVTLLPGNYPVPNASTINFSAGQTRTNNAVLPLSSDGAGTLAAQALVTSKGNLQLIVDVNGYFM